MKVLVIANLPPFVLGGAEIQVARLVKTWSGLGHHVEVAGHRLPNSLLRLGDSEVRTHRLQVFTRAGRAGRAVSYFFSMAWLLRKVGKEFDIIYCRGLGDAAVSLCLLKEVGLVQLPMVACPINAKGAGDTQFIRSIPAWRYLVRLINRHCNAINIIAPDIESDLLELGIDSPKLSRIPNGIDISPLVVRKPMSNARRMIFVGRLSQQKGLDVLLDALALLKRGKKEFYCEIVGEGPERERLINQCDRLGLEKYVSFNGATSSEAVRAKLLESDVFVLPSRYEGMSNAALEAMEAGIPVVLTRCGGIDTYVSPDIGWLCPAESALELAEVLEQVLDTNPATLVAMGKRARAMVERNFDLSVIGQKNLELLSDIIAEGRSSTVRN